MAIGPVQLIVLGFSQPNFTGEIMSALEDLRASDAVRVIDSLIVYKHADGRVQTQRFDNMTPEETIELDSKIGALIGLGYAGEEEVAAGAEAGAAFAQSGERLLPVDDVDAWDVIADIPPDSAAALVLLEHHWAIPLRNAIVRAGGLALSDGFISPLDLVEVGLMAAEDVRLLDDLARTAAVRSP